MNEYNKITALYSRLSVGDEDRDGGESNSIVNQKAFLERYAQQQRLTNIRHYIDDDESGRFFDRSAYSRMMEDVENGKIGVCIMKDLTRWGRDYLQVGNAMEVFRRNNVRFIAVNNGIDSDNPDTLEFAPFINIMSEWYAKDISKKVKTGIRTKGASGKPIATEAPYGYMKDPNNKDFWIIDEEAAEVVRLIFRLFIGGKNRNQIAVYLKNEQILTPTFYLKQHDRGTAKSRPLNEENRYKWNKATLTKILTRQEYCGDVVNFKTTILDGIIDKVVRQIFERMKAIPKSEIVNIRYREKMEERKALLKSAKSDYAKAAAELDTLRAEVIKSLRGESAFPQDLLSSLISDCETKCLEVQHTMEAAQAAYDEGQAMLDTLNAQYDDIISWADMYDNASMESKKMIVSCLIRRVEVYRDYRLHIDFNIDFEQFSVGLDISAIAA